MKLFYDPAAARDPYVNRRDTAASREGLRLTAEAESGQHRTSTPAVPTATLIPTSTGAPGGALGDGCVNGQVFLQGRASHLGVPIGVDHSVAAVTSRDGSFEACGLRSGPHAVSAGKYCYLERQEAVALESGSRSRLPSVELAGGDADGDGRIDVRDLVRMAEAFGFVGQSTEVPDCTGDGEVGYADLALVASNYGAAGPMSWLTAAGAAIISPPPLADRVQDTFGPEDGLPVALSATPMHDGTIRVDVAAGTVDGLVGADIGLAYDPKALAVVDASEQPGVQAMPGLVWNRDGESYIAVNEARSERGSVRFAAARLRPATALSGDLVLLTGTFRVIGDVGDDARRVAEFLALDRVELYGVGGTEIAARWQGVATWTGWDVYLPAVANR